jgi:hypothetical protein
MFVPVEMERDRIVAAIKAEFAAGPQTLERMKAIAHRRCGSRWQPTCMPVIGGGFDMAVMLRQP